MGRRRGTLAGIWRQDKRDRTRVFPKKPFAGRKHVQDGSSIFPMTYNDPLTGSLIRLGLRDKSHQVRGKAAEAACRLGLTDLIRELEASLKEEKHPIARQSLELAVALLRDGYLLQRTGGKLTNVWVKRERDRGYCISVPITDDDLRNGRLSAIIAGAKAMPPRPQIGSGAT